MSSANAAAKKRRVTMSTPSQNFQSQPQNFQSQPQNFQSQPQNFQSQQQQQQQQQQQPQQSQPQGPPNAQGLLTLPQVIALVDSRLTNLEKKSGNDEYFEEFETRFEIMAQELADMKQIVLSLQSYTMDVNRMLMDERKPPNSSLDSNSTTYQPTFSLYKESTETLN